MFMKILLPRPTFPLPKVSPTIDKKGHLVGGKIWIFALISTIRPHEVVSNLINLTIPRELTVKRTETFALR